MEFVDYREWELHGLEGDSILERAYYVCPDCEGETIFPLDKKLQLRADHMERRGSASSDTARFTNEVI